MPEIQKTWVQFKQSFRTSHRELRETSDLTIEDTGMHHSNILCNVVLGIQEATYQSHIETPTFVQAPVDHVDNEVQNTHQLLATQLQQIQAMMQAM